MYAKEFKNSFTCMTNSQRVVSAVTDVFLLKYYHHFLPVSSGHPSNWKVAKISFLNSWS